MAVSYDWIYAKDLRAVPEWIVKGHSWHNPVPIEKLQMKVKMCCLKCEEKVQEEIREVEGVVDVRTEREDRKVVVVVVPKIEGDLERKVLKKARKVDKEAQFVELEAYEKARDKPNDKGQGEKKGKGGTRDGMVPPPVIFVAGPPLPGNVYGAGNWTPFRDREPPAPTDNFPSSDNTGSIPNSPQHLSILPSNSTKSTRPKRKPRSIFKKVIIWLFG